MHLLHNCFHIVSSPSEEVMKLTMFFFSFLSHVKFWGNVSAQWRRRNTTEWFHYTFETKYIYLPKVWSSISGETSLKLLPATQA